MTETVNHTNQEEYTLPIYENGRFKNPWDTWTDVTVKNLLRLVWQLKDTSGVPKTEEELNQTLPVHKPDFSKLENPPESGVQAMWIGHATVLVQFDGITVVTDPVFSDKCSPFSWLSPARYRPPPCRIEELKKIDAIVISHNHYDHLDTASVKEFNRCFEDSLCWFVPMGTKRWMEESGCKKVVELTWWEEKPHPDKPNFTFALTPSQHWCRRGVLDTNKALWGSWVVKGPRHNFFFAGDTGYCSGFKQIGRKYGPFSLAAIPIGAYHPRWFMSPQHVDPEEAVKIHEDIKSQTSVGIHWGTFKMTYEPYLEPKEKLAEELKKRDMNPSAFVTLPHGDVNVFGANTKENNP